MHHPLKYTCIQEHVQYYVICVIKYHKGWFVESWLNKRKYSLMVSNRWTYLWPGSQTQWHTRTHLHKRIHMHNTPPYTHTQYRPAHTHTNTQTNSGYHRTELYPSVQFTHPTVTCTAAQSEPCWVWYSVFVWQHLSCLISADFEKSAKGITGRLLYTLPLHRKNTNVTLN